MELQARLKELSKKHKVPGASVAIFSDDEVETAVAGVVNKRTRVRTTPDTYFQIGSITKVYTATLIMQLVDEGKVELDEPVRRYIPDLKLPDETVAGQLTVRDLLTHTSGLAGDYFPTFGRGDDAIKRYVKSLHKIDLAHPRGFVWSYSNAGYVLAGHVVERVTKLTWDEALKTRLLQPAGLSEHASLAEEVMLHRFAVGHQWNGKSFQPAAVWQLDRSSAPAGASLCATPRDVVAFANIHMNEGRAADGTEILSVASTKAMQTEQLARPGGDGLGMGLGWVFTDWRSNDGPVRIVWHNGGTLGQNSHLFVVPTKRFAMCVLTNSGGGPAVIGELAKEMLGERLGMRPPDTPSLPKAHPGVDISKYTGTYTRHLLRYDASVVDGELRVELRSEEHPTEDPPHAVYNLKPLNASRFAIVAGGTVAGVIEFLGFDDDGRPEYLSLSRVARRVK